jgi:hypothetical protein
VSPQATQRSFFYGINFELSYNSVHWENTRFSGEIRPIIGFRQGDWDFIINPILDTDFRGIGHLDFAPSERLAFNFSPTWAIALEHYSDYGEFISLQSINRQEHSLWLVLDYKKDESYTIETGIGHGLTGVTEDMMMKVIISFDF